MGMYKGKEICQGCHRPGAEHPRWNKDSLCEDCKKSLAVGRAAEKNEAPDFIYTKGVRYFSKGGSLEDYEGNGSSSKSKRSVNVAGGPYVSEFGYSAQVVGDDSMTKAMNELIDSIAVDAVSKYTGRLEFPENSVRRQGKYVRRPQAVAILALMDVVMQWGAGIEARAHNEGKSLLMGLLKGTTTTEEIDRTVSRQTTNLIQ